MKARSASTNFRLHRLEVGKDLKSQEAEQIADAFSALAHMDRDFTERASPAALPFM